MPGECGSIFAGVEQLPPGTCCAGSAASGRLQVRPYWRPPAPLAAVPESAAELAAEAGRLLEQSVRDRLVADVPLGVFLSGGVDSSLIAAIAARQSRAAV